MSKAKTKVGTNGVHVGKTDEKIADALQEEMSLGYKPQLPLEALWSGGGDSPSVTLRRDLEFMQLHPTVCTAIEYYKSGIAGAEFWGGPDQLDTDNEKGKPISMNKDVAQFVLAHAERFWQRGVPVFQEGYVYGWAPGEHIYKEVEGKLVWSHVKGFAPSDGFILTCDHKPVGARIKNILESKVHRNQDGGGGTMDLWFASENIPAKAAWYSHRPKFNQFYGRSQLSAGWRPWRRLGWRDGVEQVIDAAIYRAGYKGPVVRHPPEDMQTARSGIPGTQVDASGGSRRSAQDVARQLVEWAKAGAGFTLSSSMYSQSMGGGKKWDIEWPDHVMDVRPLIEAARYLEDQIMLGIGVPPELVKAGGTGSGYSGRSIPREAFLDGQQRIADAMLQLFVEQVIRPLVWWNFGEVPFNIQCKPLLKTQIENKQGQPQAPLPQPGEQPAQQGQPGADGGPGPDPKKSQAMKDSWTKRNVNNPGGAGGGQPPPSPAFSMDDPVHRRAFDIVMDVMRRRAA